MMKLTYRTLASATDGQVAADAFTLHVALLPDSPVVRFGRRFAEQVYYGLLPALDLVWAKVAYVDGVPAGFIAVTDRPADLMSVAARSHWPVLLRAFSGAMLRRPARLALLLEAWRIQRGARRAGGEGAADNQPAASGNGGEADRNAGEILSYGVLPRYRGSLRGGTGEPARRLAAELFDAALAELARRGATTVRAVVDRDNLPVRLLYGMRGFRLARSEVPGWPVPSVEYVVDQIGDARDHERSHVPRKERATCAGSSVTSAADRPLSCCSTG